MSDTDTIQVWRYSTPGTRPLSQKVSRDSQPDQGRWRGDTICESDLCGGWVSDIDPLTLQFCMPLPCPTCEARSGYPRLLWRDTHLECKFCGMWARFQLIDPSEKWPKSVTCPKCESSVKITLSGASRMH